jgi:hypothetical protein
VGRNGGMALSKLEQEAVILNAVWDAIDGIANQGVFVKMQRLYDTNVIFEESTHAALCNILLGDFLAQPQARDNQPLPFDLPRPPSSARRSDLTYLFYLRQICDDPKLGTDPSELRSRVDAFGEWLEDVSVIKDVWFGSISLKTDITIPRIDYLRICADIAKHNFARLQHNVRKIRRILEENGSTISESNGFLAIPDFFEWFHDDLFIYHSSAIAEFLNNIRWSIYRYLRPEFERAYRRDETNLSFPNYSFDVPAGFNDQLARTMYWDVMNRMRSRPCMPEFTISDAFKQK